MKRLTITRSSVALLAVLAGACTGDVPSAAAPTDPTLARAPAEYTVLNVGALLGDYSSAARAVNNAGDLAGHYCCDPGTRAFALVSGAPVFLGGASGAAWGMSNGSPALVAGSADGLPVLWSLAGPASPMPLERTAAEIAAEASGTARGVNVAGAAVGDVAGVPAMWAAGGSRIVDAIATPAGYGRGEGRGIDDAGHAIFQFFVPGGNQETADSRAYVRLATGVVVELPPVGTDVTSFANDIGEEASGLVYVAGSTRSSELVSRAVRWTVDVAAASVVGVDLIATTGAHGLGVSDAGGIAGFVDVGSFKSYAYLWRGAGLLKLNAPKGTRDSKAWAMSRSGQYVAGQAIGGSTQAVRWTIATP